MPLRASLPLTIATLVLVSGLARAHDPEEPEKEWACSSEQMKRVLESADARMVRIEGRMESSLGFVFHSSRHVLTTFSAVFWHEGLTVHLRDGTTSKVRVVAKNEMADLALVELDHDSGIEPLPVGPEIEVGDPVFAVGRASLYGAWSADPEIHAGVVNSKKEDAFRTDALEHGFMREGGPVFDCRGKLVGLALSNWGRSVVPIAIAETLVGQIGRQRIYEGPVVRPHFETGLVAQLAPDSAGGGLALGFGLVFHDVLELKLKGGLLAAALLDDADTRGLRIYGQTLVGTRLFLDDDEDFSINLAVGATLAHDSFCAGGCNENTAPTFQRTRLLPTAEAGFQFWPGYASYQYQVDVETPELSTHQLMIGLQF
jgi:hypothetical protein